MNAKFSKLIFFIFIIPLNGCFRQKSDLILTTEKNMEILNNRTIEEIWDKKILEKQKNLENLDDFSKYNAKEKTLIIFFHGLGDSEFKDGSWVLNKYNKDDNSVTGNEFYHLEKNFKEVGGKNLTFEFVSPRDTINLSLEDQFTVVSDNVKDIIRNSDAKNICLLGYSMGGLVAEKFCYHACDIKEIQNSQRIFLATLASPVRGLDYDSSFDLDFKNIFEEISNEITLQINKSYDKSLKTFWNGDYKSNPTGGFYYLEEAGKSKVVFDRTSFKKISDENNLPESIKDMRKSSRESYIPPEDVPTLNIVARESSIGLLKYAIKRYLEEKKLDEGIYEKICKILDDEQVREKINPLLFKISDHFNKKIRHTPINYEARNDGVVDVRSQFYEDKKCKRVDIIAHHNESPAVKAVPIRVLEFINKKSQ